MTNYSIYLRDGLLFSYLEYVGEDYESDMKAVDDDRDTQEWWKLTDPMQAPLPVHPQTEWWANMDLLYTYNASINTAGSSSRRIAYVAASEEDPRVLANEAHGSGGSLPLSVAAGIAVNKFSVFAGYGRVCLYAEITGRSQRGDTASPGRILSLDDAKWDIQRHLKSDWQEMREVFFAE